MAYGAKYIASFSDVYQDTKNQYNVIIYKKDYSDYVYELSCDGEPFVVQTDRVGDSSYRPVIGSTAQFNVLLQNITLRYWEDIPTNWDAYTGLWNAETFDFSEFLTAEADTFYVELKKKNIGGTYDLKWKGWYIPTSDTIIDEIEPIFFSLTFSDLTLMKSYEYGDDIAAPPAPQTLATVSFAQSTGGNLTFDASTSSGLVIDTTTGGYYRIKNTGVDPVQVRFVVTINATNNLQFGDVATIQALSSNDASVNTAIEFSEIPIYQNQASVTATVDFALSQNDGVRFILTLSNIIPPYTPAGTFTLLTTSGVVAQEPVNFDSSAVLYEAAEHDTITNILISCVQNSKLDINARLNTSFTWNQVLSFDPELGITYTSLNFDDIHIYHNAFLLNNGKYDTYYNVLVGICNNFGLVAYQRDGYFYISTYDDLVNKVSREYKEYSYVNKALVSTFIETDTIIGLNTSTFKNIGRSQEVRYVLPSKYVDLNGDPCKSQFQYNWKLSAIERRLASGGLYESYLSDWELFGYATKDIFLAPVNFAYGQFSQYATIPSSPYDFYYGAASFTAAITAQDNTKYIESKNGVSVKQGDFVSISVNMDTDARLNPANLPQTKVAVVFKYPDPEDANTIFTFYLNATGTKFIPTLTYQPLQNIDIKGLKMPREGTVHLRILMPWANPIGSPLSPTTASALYINYAMIQSYTGAVEGPTGQTFRTFTAGNYFNNDSVELDSNLYTYDLYRYATDTVDPTIPNSPSEVSPWLNVSSVGNIIHDKWHREVFSSDNIMANQICENIYKNTGFPNATIVGGYKSTGYPIGSKFSYAITGFTQKNFVLLDYMNSYKSGTQDVVLYSSEFVDTSEKDIITQLIVD